MEGSGEGGGVSNPQRSQTQGHTCHERFVMKTFVVEAEGLSEDITLHAVESII